MWTGKLSVSGSETELERERDREGCRECEAGAMMVGQLLCPERCKGGNVDRETCIKWQRDRAGERERLRNGGWEVKRGVMREKWREVRRGRVSELWRG